MQAYHLIYDGARHMVYENSTCHPTSTVLAYPEIFQKSSVSKTEVAHRNKNSTPSSVSEILSLE